MNVHAMTSLGQRCARDTSPMLRGPKPNEANVFNARKQTKSCYQNFIIDTIKYPYCTLQQETSTRGVLTHTNMSQLVQYYETRLDYAFPVSCLGIAQGPEGSRRASGWAPEFHSLTHSLTVMTITLISLI